MNMKQTKNYPAWNLRHEGVLRWIFEHPAAKQKDCAKELKYSESQISRIVNSDEFRSKYRMMSDLHFLEIIKHRKSLY